jgi:hypothetical protein
MIDNYKFGLITIDGKEYSYDVMVSWQDKVSQWTREKSHDIGSSAIQEALAKRPSLIVIGTGKSGIAQLREEARKKILNQDIRLITDKTPEAIKAFNMLREKNFKVVGLFHLTC